MADFLLDEFEKREAEVRCSRLTRPYTMCHTLMQAWTQIKLDFIVAEPTEASYQKDPCTAMCHQWDDGDTEPVSYFHTFNNVYVQIPAELDTYWWRMRQQESAAEVAKKKAEEEAMKKKLRGDRFQKAL